LISKKGGKAMSETRRELAAFKSREHLYVAVSADNTASGCRLSFVTASSPRY